ncbi:unnamed protein product [Hydatigera taeniaeformis]|uniref:Kinesin motor domain-containing protein n=1 Tax=Hydatigena taeniaeformis TaxID=6205 RepID=A0A0R3X819_HYDTA|nr:unnamed protein product [Hydatigera taeniaeformis]
MLRAYTKSPPHQLLHSSPLLSSPRLGSPRLCFPPISNPLSSSPPFAHLSNEHSTTYALTLVPSQPNLLASTIPNRQLTTRHLAFSMNKVVLTTRRPD